MNKKTIRDVDVQGKRVLVHDSAHHRLDHRQVGHVERGHDQPLLGGPFDDVIGVVHILCLLWWNNMRNLPGQAAD